MYGVMFPTVKARLPRLLLPVIDNGYLRMRDVFDNLLAQMTQQRGRLFEYHHRMTLSSSEQNHLHLGVLREIGAALLAAELGLHSSPCIHVKQLSSEKDFHNYHLMDSSLAREGN